MKLSKINGSFSICQLKGNADIPQWIYQSSFFNISKTSEELSIVCEEQNVPADVKQNSGWTAFKVEGPLDFNLTGILASIANPLAEAKISIFAVSTFDTDYVFVKSDQFEKARHILTANGFTF